jgi:hypothetical protein
MMDSNEVIKLNKKFGYVVAGVLLFIAVFQFIFKQKQDLLIIVIAMTLFLLAIIKPVWLTHFRIVWDKIGHVLGIINTYVLLTVFYSLILTPLGLIMRLLGKDILKQKRSPNEITYWEPESNPEDSKMENQF